MPDAIRYQDHALREPGEQQYAEPPKFSVRPATSRDPSLQDQDAGLAHFHTRQAISSLECAVIQIARGKVGELEDERPAKLRANLDELEALIAKAREGLDTGERK